MLYRSLKPLGLIGLLVACGSDSPDTTYVGGAAGDDGTAADVAGDVGAGGTTAAAGVADAVETGGSGGPGDPRWALISGDPKRCPARADLGFSARFCAEPPDSDCVYAGGYFGLSWTEGLVACFCAAPRTDAGPSQASWLCLSANEGSTTECPREYPPSGSCTPGQHCVYGIGIAMASCYCDSSGGFGTCGL